jgi:hypothetical protein
MVKLKLSALTEDKPVKFTIELPGAVHRDLVVYAELLSRDSGQSAPDPSKLIAPMVQRFIATDREFAKLKRASARTSSV